MPQEFEIKFIKIDKNQVREKCKSMGLACTTDEFLMIRKTFHPITTEKNEWFRIRQESDKITMTYKCIHNDSIDGMEEHEIIVDDFDAAAQILEKTGLKNTSTQENYREIWKNDAIEICIDTWPGLLPYIEIEGKNQEIVKKYVEKMWYDLHDWLFGGSEVVYEKELGIDPKILISLPEITFKNPPKIL